MSRLDDFVADIASSGLVPSGDLDRALAGFAREPDADAPVRLARALIQQRKLTPYQARKLLAGATRGFFLGGYRILRSLGEGGMGKVFLAVREGTASRSRSRSCPPRRRSKRARPCSGSAARWTSRGASRTRTWPGRSTSARRTACTSWSWNTSPARASTRPSRTRAAARSASPTPARFFLKVRRRPRSRARRRA